MIDFVSRNKKDQRGIKHLVIKAKLMKVRRLTAVDFLTTKRKLRP